MVYEVVWFTDGGKCRKLTFNPTAECKRIVDKGGVILSAHPVKQTKGNINTAKRNDGIFY